MINESIEVTHVSDVTVNIENIDISINISIVVGLFMFGLFLIVKNKVLVNILPIILNILRTFFSKIKPIWVKLSSQVLKMTKIKRTLLLAGSCVLFILILL